MRIYPFALSHDDPCVGYHIYYCNQLLTYNTDTGVIDERYLMRIKESDYLYLEFNHDLDLLMATPRPEFVKQRILAPNGHMNNIEAAYVVAQTNARLKTLLVAHISEQANSHKAIWQALEEACTKANKPLTFEIKYTQHNVITSAGHKG